MTRIEKLAGALRDSGVDCYLAWDAKSMGYLHGYFENAHERFLVLAIDAKGEVRMICPSLAETQARRVGISNIESWSDGEDPVRLFSKLADDWNLKSGIIAIDPTMPSRQLLQLQAALPAALFRDGESLLASLMARKDADELAALQAAANVADEAWVEVKPQIHAGMTEREVADLLKSAMSKRGGSPQFFIVAAGAMGAEPHHISDGTVIRDGDVVICDFGCEVDGYQSDITRTICVGEPSAKAREVYDVVLKAHHAARAVVRPGVTGEEVDAAARKVIDDAGYGDAFFHRTGHGIGMSGHELPNMVQGNTAPLQAGNCFSIEPGIYLAGEFGVRIENIVTCTETGGRSFNAEPESSL
jgi:Xaa-Pro aminopeptidase